MYSIKKQDKQTVIEIVNSVSTQERISHIWSQMTMRFRELIVYRGLIRNMVARDLKVRYKNSILGVLWSLLNPLLMMLVFTVVFTVMRNRAIDNFPAFMLIGLLPWQFFQDGVSSATSSIVTNNALINKVYFPREILVISGVLSNLVNFLIALTLLIPILIYFNIQLTSWVLLLPVMIIIQVIFTLGIGFIVATANVFYRDVSMVTSVALLAGFFLTPIFYPSEELPPSYTLFGIDWDIERMMFWLNPMASIIEGYRRILFYGTEHAPDFLVRTFLTAMIVLVIGLIFFYRNNHRFGEII